MIVKDKAATIQKAHEITSIIMKLMAKELEGFHLDDDPAEQIYLTCHVLGNVYARILVILKGYGETYNIPNINFKCITEWIDEITKEYLEHYDQHLIKSEELT